MNENQNQTTNLTPAQQRVLKFLDAYPQWHSLVELDQIKLLETDDVLTIPSLIEKGFVMHFAAIKAVAITASGAVIGDELRSADWKAKNNVAK